jgi:hypothetical protein
MRLEGRRIICLRALKRHVFAPRYNPPMHESGEHVLEFISSGGVYFPLPSVLSFYWSWDCPGLIYIADARDFMDSIDDLAEAYMNERRQPRA